MKLSPELLGALENTILCKNQNYPDDYIIKILVKYAGDCEFIYKGCVHLTSS